MITSVFRITIHLSELGLVSLEPDCMFLSAVDFLSTVHGDYGRDEIENILFVYENIKYQTTSLLCKKNDLIPSQGCWERVDQTPAQNNDFQILNL